MILAIGYLIVGLITFIGLTLEHYQQEGRRLDRTDLIAVPALLVTLSVGWLPLYAWAFCGPNRHRMQWNS